MGKKLILSAQVFVNKWKANDVEVRREVEAVFGKEHIHRPVRFAVTDSHDHGMICADCGEVLQWG